MAVLEEEQIIPNKYNGFPTHHLNVSCNIKSEEEEEKEKKKGRRKEAIMAMALKMATTGMKVLDECKSSFMDMKWKKEARYVVYKIDEQAKTIKVDKIGCPGQGHESLAADLPDNDCRYAVLDFDFVNADHCEKSKIFFIAWSPPASRIREKILYATSKQGLRGVLEGINYDMQVTDPAEMGIEIIRETAK